MIPNPLFQNVTFSSTNYETGITYDIKLNDAICGLTLVRVLPLVSGLVSNTGYYSMRMQRLSILYGFKADFVFGLKCLIKQHSLFIISVGMISSIFLFSFGIRVCEM